MERKCDDNGAGVANGKSKWKYGSNTDICNPKIVKEKRAEGEKLLDLPIMVADSSTAYSNPLCCSVAVQYMFIDNCSSSQQVMLLIREFTMVPLSSLIKHHRNAR